jgi:phospho-N-acetylmuramoyl-pentapeptide-transferase
LISLYLFCPPISQTFQGRWFSPPIIKEQLTARIHNSEANLALTKEGSVKNENILNLKEYASRFYLPFFKDPIFSFTGFFVIFGVLFLAIVLTGSSNAVNLTDGLYGLYSFCF